MIIKNILAGRNIPPGRTPGTIFLPKALFKSLSNQTEAVGGGGIFWNSEARISVMVWTASARYIVFFLFLIAIISPLYHPPPLFS